MNKLTLIVDSNWLLLSRFSVLSKGFKKNNSNIIKEQTTSELNELLARSICVILNRFSMIDNIILVADGGSWRKSIPIPSQLDGITYKGNRSSDSDFDWNYVYDSLKSLLNNAEKNNITVSQHYMIEGDDWIWYWSRRLNREGVNCLIWSSDNDLKQLVQLDNNTNAFTAWYNDKNGLWLHDIISDNIDPLDFFMKFEYYSPTLEYIKSRASSVNYIKPEDIVTSKIICGDTSDNIMPVVRYKKNTRTYRITEKDWQRICNDINSLDINEIAKQSNNIAHVILQDKKFKPLVKSGLLQESVGDIAEMIEYNTKLVWLHDSTIPRDVIDNMDNQEYKLYDISYLKSNYKVLVNNDIDIENLFNSI